jgi:hypothetical protein
MRIDEVRDVARLRMRITKFDIFYFKSDFQNLLTLKKHIKIIKFLTDIKTIF